MIDSKFVLIGAILNLSGSINYVLDTLRGKTKPNRITWILWALAPLIAFAAELNEGVGLQALMTFMVGFGPLMIVIASFVNKKSFWQLTTFDYVCGGLSILGLLLWAITRHGNIAIIFSILADTLAAVPTIVKSYKQPQTESAYIFIAGAISAAITLLTIDNWNLAHYGFPLYVLVICSFLGALIQFKIGPRLGAKTA